MKKITLFSILAVFVAALSFTSCNSSDGSSYVPPTQEEARSALSIIAGSGYNQCGILFGADEKNNIKEKDSVETTIAINVSDSSYQIRDFPVKLLAKYVNDEKCSKLISELPNQTLKGKLYLYDYASKFFFSVTENINFTDEDGDKYTLVFYGGFNTYASAGISNDKKHFIIYLTPGAIYKGTQLMDNALKTTVGQYGTVPYTVILSYVLPTTL